MDMFWYKRTKRFEELKKPERSNRIEANLPQEKIDFIIAAYAEEVDYWKRAALESKNEEGRKQITNLAKFFLARKDSGKSRVENIYEVLFYLKELRNRVE